MGREARRRVGLLFCALLVAACATEVLLGQTNDPSTDPSGASPGSGSAAAPAGGSKTLAGGLTLSGKQAGWKGIYPGRSHTADVKAALGEPAGTDEENGFTRLIYGPDAGLKFNAVYLDATGLVKKIGWARFEEELRVPPAELWLSLGEPRMLSPFSFIKQGAIYQWQGAALWGVVDKPNNAVITMVFYDPADTPQIPIPSGPPVR